MKEFRKLREEKGESLKLSMRKVLTIIWRRKEHTRNLMNQSVNVSLPGSSTAHQSVIKDARRVRRSRYTGRKIIY